MADELTTTITSPQVKAVGETLAGALVITSPSAGNFYALIEQYTSELVFIPGSRAFLYRAGATGDFVNNTTLYSNWALAAVGVVENITVLLTLLNTDCLLYIFLKERAASVLAGAFAVGTAYEIMALGTTDFTLVGAAANAVGTTFVATGVGAGTGLAAELPDPDTDDTVDYVVITLQSTATGVSLGGIDISELMGLMINMMIVVMMMKMMMGAMTSVK